MNRHRTQLTLTSILTLFLLIAFTSSMAARPSNKWRLHFDGKAKNDGVLTLQFSPVGGQPSQIAIEIKDNTRENAASKETTQKLKEAYENDYKISHQDGEEIKIKTKRGRADFVLEVLSNTIEGLKVKTDRE